MSRMDTQRPSLCTVTHLLPYGAVAVRAVAVRAVAIRAMAIGAVAVGTVAVFPSNENIYLRILCNSFVF